MPMNKGFFPASIFVVAVSWLNEEGVVTSVHCGNAQSDLVSLVIPVHVWQDECHFRKFLIVNCYNSFISQDFVVVGSYDIGFYCHAFYASS